MSNDTNNDPGSEVRTPEPVTAGGSAEERQAIQWDLAAALDGVPAHRQAEAARAFHAQQEAARAETNAGQDQGGTTGSQDQDAAARAQALEAAGIDDVQRRELEHGINRHLEQLQAVQHGGGDERLAQHLERGQANVIHAFGGEEAARRAGNTIAEAFKLVGGNAAVEELQNARVDADPQLFTRLYTLSQVILARAEHPSGDD